MTDKLRRAEERLENEKYWKNYYEQRGDMAAVYVYRVAIAETENEIEELKGAK